MTHIIVDTLAAGTRAHPDDVRAIITTTLDDDTIQLWINVAHSIVNANLACIGNASESLLAMIETQLTAHFIAILPTSGADARLTEKEKLSGKFEITYARQAEIANSINTTIYGTAANAMSGGCLATYDKPKACAEFF